MSSTFFKLTCLLAAFGVVLAGKIPSFVKVCQRSNPNFDDCVVESVNSLRPQLIKGIPKMGVPPLEPLYIPKLVVNSVIPNIKAKLIISDIYAKGGKDFVINKLSTDLKGLTLDTEVTLPRLDVTANYKVEGSLPNSQVIRTGVFEGQFTEVLAKVKGEGETFEKDGKTYLRIKGLTADITLQGSKDIKMSPVDKGSAPMTSFIKVCRRSDPHLNECVKDSVEKIRPYLTEGIPTLGIPSCEPLELPEVMLNQGNGPVAVQSSYSNLKVWGPTNFKLTALKINYDKDLCKIKLHLPHLYMEGDYAIEGKILMLPIYGKGLTKGNYSDIEATVIIQGERLKRHNKIYMNVVDFSVSFSIGQANIHLNNLFDGDKQMGDAMNQFLNENWKNVADEIQPALEKTIGDQFKKFANKIFHKFSIDELLPP